MIRPIVRSIMSIAGAAGVDDLFLDAWPNPLNVTWLWLSGRDVTNDASRIEIQLNRAGTRYVVRAAAPGAASRSVDMTSRIIAPGDYRVGMRVIGATAGDVLEFHAYGYVEVPD